MNEENKIIIRKRIDEAAEMLKGRLPSSPRHPSGRNPYAHIPKVIISMLGKSYTQLPDSTLQEILEIIDYCEKNPF